MLGEIRKVVSDIKNESLTYTDKKTIVCDFEAGLLNAISLEFPGFDLKGDLFHLKNRLWLAGTKRGLGTNLNKLLLIFLVNALGR